MIVFPNLKIMGRLITLLFILLTAQMVAQEGILITTNGQRIGLEHVLQIGPNNIRFSSGQHDGKIYHLPLENVFLYWQPKKWPEVINSPNREILDDYPSLDRNLILWNQSKSGPNPYFSPPKYKSYKKLLGTTPWRRKNKGKVAFYLGLGIMGLGFIAGIGLLRFFGIANWANVLINRGTASSTPRVYQGVLLGSGIAFTIGFSGMFMMIGGNVARKKNAKETYNAYQLYESGYIQDHNLLPMLRLKVPLNKP